MRAIAIWTSLCTAISIAAFVLVGCGGLYGPKAFDYNTTGVVSSNLVGSYSLNNTTWILEKKGYTNLSGSIVLKPDMTFQLTDIPCLQQSSGAHIYSTASGTWKIQKHNAIWVIVLSPQVCGFIGEQFPILNDTPPHGIQIHINHDEGYWVRYSKRDSP